MPGTREAASVCFDDQLVFWMRKIDSMDVFDVTFGFLEALGERVGPSYEFIGVITGYSFLKWSKNT